MKKIGYARKTIEDESLVPQIEALTNYGCDSIYQDSEAKNETDSPQLLDALKTLDAGDALVVSRLDRLGKSLRQLTKLTEKLRDQEITFISLNESIDTSQPNGDYYFKLLEELAVMESSLIREKTLVGLKEAREKGKIGGRPKINGKTVEEIRRLYFNEKRTIQYISEKCDVSVGSVYKYINLPEREVENLLKNVT